MDTGKSGQSLSGRRWQMQRAQQTELLDNGEGAFEDVYQNLREIQRINDWLGGTSAVTRHLYPLIETLPDPLRILDVGTGGAGLCTTIARWAQRYDRTVHVIGLDWARRNLAVARRMVGQPDALSLLQGDARHIPFAPDTIDVVISTLLMHHFSPAALVEMLRNTYAHARYALVMSDLVRGWLPYFAFQLIKPVFARNRLTRADGLLSVRRAYLPMELAQIAHAAGIDNVRIAIHWPWRMTLVAIK